MDHFSNMNLSASVVFDYINANVLVKYFNFKAYFRQGTKSGFNKE